jgi:hypothetical protein
VLSAVFESLNTRKFLSRAPIGFPDLAAWANSSFYQCGDCSVALLKVSCVSTLPSAFIV